MADQGQTVLTSLALSPRAAAVAAEGLQLASIVSGRALFVHVGADEPAVRQKLREILKPLSGESEVSDENILIRQGHPGRAICATAAETKADIVVMGALDRDPPLVRVWGSVARYVARRAPCSVMLLPDPQSPHAAVRRIVASVPLNVESAEMVPLVLQLARGLPGTLVSFVHEFSVAEAEWAGDRSLAGQQREPAEAEAYVRERLRVEQELLADFLSGFDLGGVSVHLEALPGHEGVEAVDYARRTNADLLAIPARARRLTIWDRVFHHPLELALRQLPCGLLLFRPTPPRVTSAKVTRS